MIQFCALDQSPELGCQTGTEAVGRGGEGIAVDDVSHFLREVAAFEAAALLALGSGAAPTVPSCTEWVVTDLILHLGVVHRSVARLIRERMEEPPGRDDRSWLGLAEEWRDLAASWPRATAVAGTSRFA